MFCVQLKYVNYLDQYQHQLTTTSSLLFNIYIKHPLLILKLVFCLFYAYDNTLYSWFRFDFPSKKDWELPSNVISISAQEQKPDLNWKVSELVVEAGGILPPSTGRLIKFPRPADEHPSSGAKWQYHMVILAEMCLLSRKKQNWHESV